MKKWFLALTVLLIALVGCQAQPSPEEMPAVVEAEAVPEEVPTATPTLPPPTPTATPQPTPTPTPQPTPAPTPTPELVKVAVTELEGLVGVWEGGDMGALQFNADGTLLVSESLAGLADQASHGECWFEGSQLVFADADGSGEGSYTVELRTTVEGTPVSLKFRAVRDPFLDRKEVFTKRRWYWVEP
jgi:hypothetical protein